MDDWFLIEIVENKNIVFDEYSYEDDILNLK